MKGNLPVVQQTIGGKGVGLFPDDDSEYDCLFETRQEVDTFVEQLQRKRDEVFK